MNYECKSIYGHAVVTGTGVNWYLIVVVGIDPIILSSNALWDMQINMNSISNYLVKSFNH